MRRLLAVLALTLVPLAPARAEETLSQALGARGLGVVAGELAARPDPTPSDRFALAGVRFLGGVERALQLRWRVGLSGGLAEASGLPILRLPLAENPSPEPFAPPMVAALFEGVESDMAGALEALSGIRDVDEVAVEIDTADLWFDIDADGRRGGGEGVTEVAAWLLSGGFGPEMGSTAIRFDTADAAWLAAYAHLLSGVSEAVLAVDPTEAIARVTAAQARFAELGAAPRFDDFLLGDTTQWADLAGLIVMAIEGPVDPVRSRAARDHLLAMVEENRRFWRLVPRERDDDREWIPNKNQVSATGLPFPPETGAVWLAVLSEAEAVLMGEALIPYWRLGPGAGLDLAALLQDPPAIDVAGLVQGATLVPYLREGRLARADSLWRFAALTGGDSPLYAVLLN